MTNTYEWTDNPTVSGVSVYDPDVLNDCLMHLKYDVSTEFDGKIATCSKNDFSNITSVAKSTVAKLSAPSAKNISLSVGSSGSEYAAPASGYFMFRRDTTSGYIVMEIVGKLSNIMQNNTGASAAMAIYAPVQKGDTCKISYSGVASGTPVLKFIYAEGENN